MNPATAEVKPRTLPPRVSERFRAALQRFQRADRALAEAQPGEDGLDGKVAEYVDARSEMTAATIEAEDALG